MAPRAELRLSPRGEDTGEVRFYARAVADGLPGRTDRAGRGSRLRDLAPAGVLLVASLVQVGVQPIELLWVPGSGWFGFVLAVTSTVPLVWRRSHPLAAALVGSALWWLPTDGFLYLGYVAAVLLFFHVGRHEPRRWARVLACGWGIAAGTLGILLIEQARDRLVPLIFDADLQRHIASLAVPGAEAVLSIIAFWLVVLVPFAIGRVMAAQQRQAEERIEAAREAARQAAVAEERARIVRELHDVVGHEVTLMSIQSEAAAQALRLAPERAAEPIAAVRETAHRASRELRVILDLLGDGDLPVVPDERGLAELTDRARRLGIDNRVTTTGSPWRDAPRHWLAVNRIVQECLTNAGKHAPGETLDITLEWSTDGVRVRAANRAPAAPGPAGRGLPGIAERARSLGGTLETSYVDGRFEVDAWLPCAEEARR